jgi:hypothetical protein
MIFDNSTKASVIKSVTMGEKMPDVIYGRPLRPKNMFKCKNRLITKSSIISTIHQKYKLNFEFLKCLKIIINSHGICFQ